MSPAKKQNHELIHLIHRMKLNRMTMNPLEIPLRLPYRQWIFALYFVLITIIDFSCTVDGLSTTNERGMYLVHISIAFLRYIKHITTFDLIGTENEKG